MRFLQRNWISVALAASVLGMIVTGLIAYATPYSELNMGLHVGFAMLFLLGFIFHMRHNFATLGGYFRRKPRALWLLSIGIVLGVVLSVVLQLPPLYPAVAYGKSLRGQVEVAMDELAVIQTSPGTTGADLEIFIHPGAHYVSEPLPIFLGLTFRTVPQIAIWAEDERGNYLETLYITGKAATAAWLTFNPFSDAVVRRPEALPRWSHQRGVRTPDDQLMPTAEHPLPDAITAATPLSSHMVRTRLPAGHSKIRLMLEINRSFDFNEHWHRQAFPDDPIYTSNGSSGQPALIYAAELDLSGDKADWQPLPFKLVGHAHHSGQDGRIYADMEGFTTALELIDWAMVRVLPPSGGTATTAR